MNPHNQTQSGNRGIILAAVLGMILIATFLMVGLIKLSHSMSDSSKNYTTNVQSEFRSDALSERVRMGVTRFVQLKMIETTSTSISPLNGEVLLNNHGAILEENENVLSIRCIGQGPKPSGVCNSNPVLPKIYELKVQATDPRTGITSISQSEFQIQQANLSSYAFFIKNETAPFVTLGPAAFNGIFGINFAPPADQRVRFRPAESTISFQNVFMTNLANAQAAFDIPDASRVFFNQGVVDSSTAISFQALDALHNSLKSNPINESSSLEIKCSKVTFTADATVQYKEFGDIDCQEAALPSSDYDANNDQALFARGEKVLLESSGDGGKTKVNNIAIIADGDVELRSSIVRDSENLGPTDGYPIVMTTGNLVISSQMKTLFGSTLANTNVDLDETRPTIQVDLSYISISSNKKGSVQFDSSLWDATSAGSATNLGTAILNGLFVSDTTPKSRKIFENSIDGFQEVQWTYPPALAAIDTQWYKTQVGGGALVSIVTRYEKKDLDQKQALDSYSGLPIEEPNLGN